MVPSDDHKKKEILEESRVPTVEDLVKLCREMNQRNAKYIVIGGFAIMQEGFVRGTEDIDLLVETTPENEQKVIEALGTLEDGAALEIKPGEIQKYEVIRVADEIVVDLMAKASGLTYQDSKEEINMVEVEGVLIPFASTSLLIKMKQGIREKDRIDLQFLKQKLLKN